MLRQSLFNDLVCGFYPSFSSLSLALAHLPTSLHPGSLPLGLFHGLLAFGIAFPFPLLLCIIIIPDAGRRVTDLTDGFYDPRVPTASRLPSLMILGSRSATTTIRRDAYSMTA